MYVSFFRTLILYAVIVFGIRLMGKRQLGELQPTELVITIIISNIATLPLEEVDTPLFMGLVPIISLVACEVLMSLLSLHSKKARRILSGKPAIVIEHGKIDQKKLHELRYSADDLMAQLRSQSIFDVSEVEFAIVETTGTLSIYQKYLNRNMTPSTLNMPDEQQKNSPALVVVSEGYVNHTNLKVMNKTGEWVEQIAGSYHTSIDRVFLMTVDGEDKITLIKKEERH